MKRCACLCACVLLVAFAPIPMPKSESDPDKLIARFEKDIQGKAAATVAARKKTLMATLTKLQAGLAKQNKTVAAEAIRERVLLAQHLTTDNLLGKTTPTELLKKAANGKYKHLAHVLLVPADQANYNQFSDYGYWNGTSYGIANNLTPGYWVYVHPHWFIWRDGPTLP